ncbi:hypothetical protein K1719_047554 [Acacia pycnantha]|nr:hypothetical protein K1719_047554 [Acacia pycnantha]
MNQHPFSKKPCNTSWMWKGILDSIDLIIQKIQWRVGDGLNISLNHPLWWTMHQYSDSMMNFHHVSDLILHTSFNFGTLLNWNFQALNSIYSQDVAMRIARIPLPYSRREDSFITAGNPSGEYCVKDGFLNMFGELTF